MDEWIRNTGVECARAELRAYAEDLRANDLKKAKTPEVRELLKKELRAVMNKCEEIELVS